MNITLINNRDKVKEHCNRYMDSITGLVFHKSEILYQLELMEAAMEANMAYSITDHNFMYLVPVGQKRANLVVLYCDDEASKAILVTKMYELGKILRYTPRDPEVPLHNELLREVSVLMYKSNRVESIRMKPTLELVE